MKNTLCRLLGLVLLAFALTAQAQQAPRNVDELMRKSGLWKQVGSMVANIRADATRMRAQSPKGGPGDIDDPTFEALVKAMERSYGGDRLRQLIAADLASRLSVEDERNVLAWLETDVGRRMTTVEEEASAASDMQTRLLEAQKYIAAAPKERADLAERFAKALHAGESEVDVLIALTTAVVYGMSLADPRIDEGAVRKARQTLESQRARAVDQMRKLATAMYAHTYRDVPLSDVTRYAEFIESPLGVRYHDATRQALQTAFARAAIDLGREFGQLKPAAPQRS